MLTEQEFGKLKKEAKALELNTTTKLFRYIKDNFVGEDNHTITRENIRECVTSTREAPPEPVDELAKREIKHGFAVQTEQRSMKADPRPNPMTK